MLCGTFCWWEREVKEGLAADGEAPGRRFLCVFHWRWVRLLPRKWESLGTKNTKISPALSGYPLCLSFRGTMEVPSGGWAVEQFLKLFVKSDKVLGTENWLKKCHCVYIFETGSPYSLGWLLVAQSPWLSWGYWLATTPSKTEGGKSVKTCLERRLWQLKTVYHWADP